MLPQREVKVRYFKSSLKQCFCRGRRASADVVATLLALWLGDDIRGENIVRNPRLHKVSFVASEMDHIKVNIESRFQDCRSSCRAETRASSAEWHYRR
mmetsp:Transcript_33862/g.79168  ORF Transcript_33862/g.79168 Transcript_33862/m.79168 type:complete len:98 (-) Transcript_33862:3058-3351(-)